MIKLSLSISCLISKSTTGMYISFYMGVVVYIKILKTSFDFNFHFYQSFNIMNTQKHGNKGKLSIKKLLLNSL